MQHLVNQKISFAAAYIYVQSEYLGMSHSLKFVKTLRPLHIKIK